MHSAPSPELQAKIQNELPRFQQLETAMHQRIIGQQHLIQRLFVALLTQGHVLLEGVPGLAKTLSIQTLSELVKARFKRIQFTPDLLPADVLGTRIYNPETQNFEIKKGPVFTNFLLADEINRAPPKVQSALLEAMQEKQVTLGKETFTLAAPFLVLATQNPLEQEGTYPLPEAQLDRFMLKVHVDYPNPEEELLILQQHLSSEKSPLANLELDTAFLEQARVSAGQVYLDPKIQRYIVNLIYATRRPENYQLDLQDLLRTGASPRATIYLSLCARAHAYLQGRTYVIPEDVKAMAVDILRHRLGLTYEAEAQEIQAEDIVKRILDHIPIP